MHLKHIHEFYFQMFLIYLKGSQAQSSCMPIITPNKTLPILDFYKEQNLFHQINGMAKIDQIFDEICGIIASLET